MPKFKTYVAFCYICLFTADMLDVSQEDIVWSATPWWSSEFRKLGQRVVRENEEERIYKKNAYCK